MKKSFVFVTLFLVCGIISADELRNQLALDIQGVMTKVTDWRHHFHEYPELSNREFKTQASIATALTEMGLEPNLNYGITGVTAFIRGENAGPLIALRADIDGLPITEETGLDFASKNGAMHACGPVSYTHLTLPTILLV